MLAVRRASYSGLTANMRQVLALFRATDNLLAFGDGAIFARQPALTAIARYLAGPPISEDNFDTLAGQRIAKRKKLPAQLAKTTADILVPVLDRRRLPWLYAIPQRQPTRNERKMAIALTAALKTAQEVATALRGQMAKAQEADVRDALIRAGYSGTTGGDINALEPGKYRLTETQVAGVKCDVIARLYDGRLALIECKVSNSGTNSVKRLNRETAGKAGRWYATFNTEAITIAVIAGVYRLVNLRDAQENNVSIFWQHNLAPLEEFVRLAR